MPNLEAFRGIRYDLGHVGSLSDVIAPPYDVIGPELQQQLYDKHPHNCVRLIRGKDEPGDTDNGNADDENRYSRAARLLKQWQREGVLFTEGDPAIYVYHQIYTEGGVEYTRRGFMARCRLERFGEGNIHPHEETHGGAKADRLKLWKACKANLSQIFGLYPDQTNEAQQLLETAIVGVTPLESTDHLGVVNRIYPVTNVDTIAKLQGVLGGKPIYIADGHHRYETACNYRDEVAAAAGGSLASDHPANCVLMMCVSMSDPGMLVLPTHRLFRGMPEITADELVAKLGDRFATEPAGTGPDHAPAAWETIETEDDQGTLALYTGKDKQWTLCRITAAGREQMAQLSTDHSTDWQGLGVSLLHRLIVENLLDAPSTAAPKYVRSIEEVVEGLTHGDQAGEDLTGQKTAGGSFNLAAIVMPATLEHIRLISNHSERMPAKSTYFYPKVLSGLVINPLE